MQVILAIHTHCVLTHQSQTFFNAITSERKLFYKKMPPKINQIAISLTVHVVHKSATEKDWNFKIKSNYSLGDYKAVFRKVIQILQLNQRMFI